jgi:hypothetical protein
MMMVAARRCCATTTTTAAKTWTRRRACRAAPVARRRVGVRSRASASADDTDGAAASSSSMPEYLQNASTPSTMFTEHAWGESVELQSSLLRAMRIQWTHGFTSTPKSYPKCTHGFGEILAGMQAAACDAIFDVLPGDSVMDPFMGGGTTLIVGQTKGRRAIGVDVSPLSCFVSTHRNWRASLASLDALSALVSDAADMAKTGEFSAPPVAVSSDDDGVVASEDSGVPKPWRPMRDALRARLAKVSASEVDARVFEAAWFCLSVAVQRTQKSSNKRRPKGKGKSGGSGNIVSDNADKFVKITDEYVKRVLEFQAVCNQHDPAAPEASIHNMDIRQFKLKDEDKVDAVLTSCVYPGVYDYQSFARKVRAGSGAVVTSSDAEAQPLSSTFLTTTVPGDRHWPKEWLEGEIGSRKALRSDPYSFKETWQRDTDAWVAVVADCLKSGGRAAIMVGDGANINTRTSIIEAGAKSGLIELAGCTMKHVGGTLSDGSIYNQARTEHLILLQKP